jgi:uncharacterized protein YxeA
MARILIILGILVVFIGGGYFIWQKSILKTDSSQLTTGQSWSQFHGSYSTGQNGGWRSEQRRSFF